MAMVRIMKTNDMIKYKTKNRKNRVTEQGLHPKLNIQIFKNY